MASVVEMPKLSDTMEEGGIANWLKKEGDFVKDGEPLVEIETDKATMEYESPKEGYLLKILVPAGKQAALNQPIAVIGQKGEAADVPPTKASPAPAAKALVASEAKQPAPAKPTPAVPKAAPIAVPTAQPTGSERLRASPLAKKLAREHGVDLSHLTGSGPQGRIVQRDIAHALEEQPQAPAGGVAMAQPGDRLVPLSMMRKTIAKRLLAAKNEAPHFYLTVSANMTALNAWRARLNAGVEKAGSDAVKVSVNDLIVLAVAKSLRQHPGVNASWEGEAIRQYGAVNVALAAALPTGLVTPVIRGTDRLGVREIARQAKDLVKRAKAGELKNEDYAGGTFTVSNLGMFGIEEFTAIINPPQAAILAVGATMPVPWVVEDAAGEEKVVVQPRVKLTMSCDHRVIDGAVGAQFLQTLVNYLEDPLNMLT